MIFRIFFPSSPPLSSIKSFYCMQRFFVLWFSLGRWQIPVSQRWKLAGRKYFLVIVLIFVCHDIFMINVMDSGEEERKWNLENSFNLETSLSLRRKKVDRTSSTFHLTCFMFCVLGRAHKFPFTHLFLLINYHYLSLLAPHSHSLARLTNDAQLCGKISNKLQFMLV